MRMIQQAERFGFYVADVGEGVVGVYGGACGIEQPDETDDDQQRQQNL